MERRTYKNNRFITFHYQKMNSVFVLLLTFISVVSGGGHETPQQVVTRYNNYKTICTGLGYEHVSCKAGNEGIVFQSSLSKTLQNLKNKETVIYDKVWLNEGKAYNEHTGKFTATVKGIYAFSWTTLSTSGKYFISEIVHNGNVMAYSYCDGRGIGGHPSSSNQVYINMRKGDKVWIRTHGSNGLYAHGGHWCSFSGYKI
uniref:Complement C1q tumor necrosis factor-related protein 2-like n=1 Tax=Crassostrea virginica TaxID=6565 RepID=A0A8B8BHS2_CRAVI|nr:complement C1q tumor necrosis factor-related protein 2-like [Crassostrea virginica]